MSDNKAAVPSETGQDSNSELNLLLYSVISDLEYSAFNLCEKSDNEIEQGVIESTCPETTLFLAIRKLKSIAI